MRTLTALLAAAAFAACGTANATVTLVQTSDPGFYNHSIGSALNGTNGGDTPTGYFPITNDSTVNFATPPDLSTASAALGNWLTDPAHLNANWSYLAAIPNSWPVGDEVAVIYRFDTLSATNVIAQFGVDNGIFVWLDGNYIGGGRAAGGVSLGEYTFGLGDFAAGTHYLQLLLEDHGVTNGFAVQITADTFVPRPVPEPGTLSLLGLGMATLAFLLFRRRKIEARH